MLVKIMVESCDSTGIGDQNGRSRVAFIDTQDARYDYAITHDNIQGTSASISEHSNFGVTRA